MSNDTTANSPSNFWHTVQTNARLRQQFPAIQPVSRQEQLLLSFQQERLWRLEQIYPDTSVYNLLHIIHFYGSLNLRVLEKSLQEIIQRHEVLRTGFVSVKGVPFQTIGSNNFVRLSIVDLTGIPLQQREQEARRLALEEAQKPFNLTQKGLWRFQLLRLSENEHWLIRIVHHIIFDGWSHNVFMRELVIIYEALSSGKSSPFSDSMPLLQYVDFAYTQRKWPQQPGFATQLDYWKQQLSGKISSLELPTDNSHSLSVSTYQGDCQSLVFSTALTKAIKTLSYQRGVSLFVTLLTAFKVLLYAYTKQADMIVCSPVAGRHRPETKKLIGYFNNVVLIRTNLADNPNFCQLLNQVSQLASNAYANQDVPLQKLVELPNLANTVLTRAMFTLQNIPNPTFNLENLKITSEYIQRPIANFDLALSMEEKGEQLSGVLQYKTAFFNRGTIKAILEDFQALLESIVVNPEQSLSSLSSLITGDDNKKISSNQDKNSEPAPTLCSVSDNINSCTYQPPRDSLELQVTQILQKVLGCDRPIGIHDNLLSLGVSSLSIALIAEKIQGVFQTDLPLTAIFQNLTIEKVSKLLRESSSFSSTSPLIPIQPNGSKPPLFLCEGVGIYYNLIPYLGKDQPLYALMRDESTTSLHFNCVEAIATYYLQHVKKIQPEGPYFLGGLCFGGLVAFEMAQQIYSKGEEVGMLLLVDTPAGPNVYKLKPTPLRMLGHLSNLLQFGLPYLRKKLANKRGKYLRSNHNSCGTISLSSSGRIANTNQAFRESANRIAEAYQCQSYPGSVTLFTLSKRSAMTDGLFDPALGYIEPLLGWGSIVKGEIDVHYFEGEHTSILREPYIKPLGQRLRVCLEKAQSMKLVKSADICFDRCLF